MTGMLTDQKGKTLHELNQVHSILFRRPDLNYICGHEANHSEILYCFNTNVFDLHGPLQVLTLTIHFLNEVCFVGVKVSTADSSASQLL